MPHATPEDRSRYQKEYAAKNRDRIRLVKQEYRKRTLDVRKAKQKERREKYAVDIAAQKAAYYRRNREKVLAARAEYRAKYPDKVRESNYRSFKNSQQARIAQALRVRLRFALAGKYTKGTALRMLGCSIPDLMAHLESKFQPGMTWENRGKHGWHIDHIVPLAILDLTDPCELARGCHYTNLQPLWATENMAKGCRKA